MSIFARVDHWVLERTGLSKRALQAFVFGLLGATYAAVFFEAWAAPIGLLVGGAIGWLGAVFHETTRAQVRGPLVVALLALPILALVLIATTS